tara:strand:+ start:796 stop:1659 length:864 start_codon:yes stop_codon:yes gene_type:complete
MGLLDKVDNLDETKPKKAVAKKATPKKATPKKAVAKKATPKKAESKSSEPKVKKLRPTGVPEQFELSGNMPRYIGWLINFVWNFGIAIFLLSIIGSGADPDLTIGWAGAGIMIIVNWFVMPIWTGRNIGEFVSRTKYVNSSGEKPIFLHAILNNSLGFLSLIGIVLMMANFQTLSDGGMALFITGSVLVLIWIVNFFFKKNSDYSQGLFDIAFRTYLVKHVATGEETGWLARFESLGDFGDKWQQRQSDRQEKAKAKAEMKAAKAEEEAASAEDSDDASSDEDNSED